MEKNQGTVVPMLHRRQSTEFIVTVDSMFNHDFNGRVDYWWKEDSKRFFGVLQLFDYIGKQVAAYGNLQKTHRERSLMGDKKRDNLFAAADQLKSAVDEELREGAMMFIRIEFLHNATWQGLFQWAYGEPKPIKSTLELIRLMDEVVAGCGIDENAPEQADKWSEVG